MIPEYNPTVAVVDYGMGNLFSVQRACEQVGLECKITSDKNEILNSDALILPGVGAFGDAMDNLERLDLISPIKDFIASGRFFMGICLGMQLLLTGSEEFGSHEGLNIIEGMVVKFLQSLKIKVPHVGWNRIQIPKYQDSDFWSKSLLNNINNGEFMYFVHSYYAAPINKDVVLSTTEYAGIDYCSSLYWKNIFAVQFHPEKSSQMGIRIYQNFAKITKHKKENG